ncbi:hypothetical protein C8J56DRAFT_422143 [Mycena floridula]|nr:hypothetical protein C8J56DRAFT_422143 [Mycena floridula]
MPVFTRRAALAQKAILNVLPNELTTEIISLCDSSSQAALCCVSKCFKQLAHRRLYQIVCLEDDPGITSFDRVVSKNPQYAGWIRNLTINPSKTSVLDLTNILQGTTELCHLSLELPAVVPDWARLSFPRMKILRFYGYDKTDQAVLWSFLNRLTRPFAPYFHYPDNLHSY